MELIEYLKQLDEKYYNEQDEEHEFAIKELMKVYKSVMNDPELLQAFTEEAPYLCGGAFIPYLFWLTLAKFSQNSEEFRPQIIELIKAFCKSDFNDQDVTSLKPLLITYFVLERPFEIEKLKVFVIQKSHPKVIQYFQKILTFVEKNKDSVKTYVEKFNLVKHLAPNFELFSKPIAHVREELKTMKKA